MKLLIAILMIIPLVNAFGVSTPFWGEHQLVMAPGETKDAYVELQNMVGDEDITLKAEITKGSEIATLIDPSTEYLIPSGTRDVKVNIQVTMPKNVPLESTYNIEVSFKQVTEAQGGMMQMAGGVGTTIPVIVKLPTPPTGQAIKENEWNNKASIAVLTLLIALLFIIGYATIKKRKNVR